MSFARAELPLFTGGVVGIVEAKLAETSFGGGVPENGFVLAKTRSELVLAVWDCDPVQVIIDCPQKRRHEGCLRGESHETRCQSTGL